MSYGTKYTAEWSSKNLSGYLYIDRKDYTGSSTDIILKNKSISINRAFENWESYIIGNTCEFEIFNNKTDYFDLIELMTATEKQFKIRIVTSDSLKLFEGFLNLQTATQRYLNNQVIRLVASSYLSKLKHIIPDSLDELKSMTFIDIIDEILRSTGGEFDIRVNCSLYANGDTLDSGQTLFNKNGFFTEAFWENNVDKKNSLEILESILNSFNCYLYWWDGYWYIEHFDDLWEPDGVDYVEYTSNTSYSPTGVGGTGNFSRGTADVGNLQFIEKSQELSITPGNKLIRINGNVEDGLLLNLVINDFSDVESVSGVFPYPALRTWQKWDEDGFLSWVENRTRNNITKAIYRDWWQGGVSESGGNYYVDKEEIEYHRGLYTRFRSTITEDSKLEFEFKVGVADGSFYYIELDGKVVLYYEGSLSDYEFVFTWYLRHPIENYDIYDYFIVYDEDAEEWKHISSTEKDALQEVRIDGSNFDKDNMTIKVSFNIPIGEIDDLIGNQDFVLGICTERFTRKNAWGCHYCESDLPCWYCWYGDVKVKANSELGNDVIEGSINTDFLDKKEIDMDLFDMANRNYKNGILRGTDLNISTENWTLDGVDYYTLVEWMLINKFKFSTKD